MGGLDNKIAIIVGGGSGLGRSVALALAREGANVVVAGRTQSAIDGTVDLVNGIGGKALAVKVDATMKPEVVKMVDTTIEKFGSIDILVNCQGYNVLKPTIETTEDEWQAVVFSNMKSVYLTCQAVIPQMIKQGGGHIFNVSSRAGLWYPGGGMIPLYKGAKLGLIGFSKALADENRKYNVKVNILAPAPMDTPMRWRDTPNFDHKKVISPDRVASLIALLASWSDTYIEEVIVPISINYP
jgi:NAD(P)-dependent dehydrogenase (short-subunit alcohol dehydrogenase family)